MVQPFFHIVDKELLLRLRAGDAGAFEEIYHTYKEPLAKNLLRLLRDEALAQDALQDLFMKVWQGRERIDPDKSFRAYLYRIAQHLVVDYYRKAAADGRLQAAMLRDTHMVPSLEDQLVDREQLQIVQHLIDQLPEERRTVFTMHKIEGRSYKEISELLNLSPAAIGKHIYHTNRLIRDYLSRHPEMLLALCLLGI